MPTFPQDRQLLKGEEGPAWLRGGWEEDREAHRAPYKLKALCVIPSHPSMGNLAQRWQACSPGNSAVIGHGFAGSVSPDSEKQFQMLPSKVCPPLRHILNARLCDFECSHDLGDLPRMEMEATSRLHTPPLALHRPRLCITPPSVPRSPCVYV